MKKEKKENIHKENEPRLQPITDILETNFMPYAMSVIVSRAIPEIDGLKPSHRKLLYTMYKMGLLKGDRTKSANVVGQTMKLNPHGDQAIYETMVRMTRGNEALLHPFVDSKGNFGKQYSRDMSYAASRYTEVKLSAICAEMFRDIDKDCVPFTPNYDGTIMEPVMLPSAFPNILVNASQGIAVGIASNLPSFNLVEVCDCIIAYLKDRDINIADYLKCLDFSTGGYAIYDKAELESIFANGRGRVRLRAKYNIDKKGSHIEITEIPYTTSAEAIIESIIALVKSSKIKDITDVRDETDITGLKITIDVKKGTDIDKLMAKLFAKTPLEDYFSCNNNVLIEGKPLLLGVKDIIDYWIVFRVECIKRQLRYDLAKDRERLHLLLGLERVLLDIDEAIRIIRNTEMESEVIPNLMEAFRIDNLQAEFIAEIKLRHLNREYILKRLDDIKDLNNSIKEAEETLKSRTRIENIISSQLMEIKTKYGQPRKTEIIYEEQMEEEFEEPAFEDYPVRVFFTKDNYLKKIRDIDFKQDVDNKFKNEDILLHEATSHNGAELVMFSNKGNVYKSKLYQINDCKPADFGEYLPNICELEKDERIIYIAITDDFKGNMIYLFENGKGAKVPFKTFWTKQNRKKMLNAYFMGSKLLYLALLDEKDESSYVAITSDQRALIFKSTDITIKDKRDTQGITLIKLKSGTKVT
ncbi:MAG TPA: DNA topoisomerase (ATP-hydrolyzing) subunit A, partial [Clostridia bacterium]|nr:DNA topoisomerase (ATP-hydrolyzing) subunit A [Clostridia bacterium]